MIKKSYVWSILIKFILFPFPYFYPMFNNKVWLTHTIFPLRFGCNFISINDTIFLSISKYSIYSPTPFRICNLVTITPFLTKNFGYCSSILKSLTGFPKKVILKFKIQQKYYNSIFTHFSQFGQEQLMSTLWKIGNWICLLILPICQFFNDFLYIQ